MSEVTFGAGAVPAADVAHAPAAPSQLPAVAPSRAVAKSTGLSSGDFVPSFADVILPNINLAHAVGELGESFEPGSIVFNQAVALYVPAKLDKNNAIVRKPTPPVIFTILGLKPNRSNPNEYTRFVEKVPGGGRGAIVETEEEVAAQGGTVDWAEWNLKKAQGMKKFDYLSTLLVVVQRPEAIPDDGRIFNLTVDKTKVALAWWNVKGSAYTEAMKRSLSPARKMGCLREGGYPSWSFAVTTFYKGYSGNVAAWVPVLVPNQPSSKAMLAFADEVLGRAPTVEAAATSAC